MQALIALNGLAIAVVIVILINHKKETTKVLTEINNIVKKNEENEAAFKKEVKELISKEFLAMAFRGIRYWK